MVMRKKNTMKVRSQVTMMTHDEEKGCLSFSPSRLLLVNLLLLLSRCTQVSQSMADSLSRSSEQVGYQRTLNQVTRAIDCRLLSFISIFTGQMQLPLLHYLLLVSYFHSSSLTNSDAARDSRKTWLFLWQISFFPPV